MTSQGQAAYNLWCAGSGAVATQAPCIHHMRMHPRNHRQLVRQLARSPAGPGKSQTKVNRRNDCLHHYDYHNHLATMAMMTPVQSASDKPDTDLPGGIRRPRNMMRSQQHQVHPSHASWDWASPSMQKLTDLEGVFDLRMPTPFTTLRSMMQFG